ncbi:MAG TPA: exodeoxyribonuclease VII small subunit [Planctomycetota bacterium]|jgi:exodeoxyribonuclease VII small subunit|nr:exodeoxyribonuclease VII small subunit [Planctomycetota bacterium]
MAERFEDRLRELEEILRRLERGDLSLDDSVAEYEKGIAALRSCRSVLASAERKIEELVRAPDGTAATKPFEHEAFKA